MALASTLGPRSFRAVHALLFERGADVVQAGVQLGAVVEQFVDRLHQRVIRSAEMP